jgi:hypothetical protein
MEKAMQTLPLEQIEAAWRDGEAERRYWDAHQSELLQRFPDEYVAIVNGEIVIHAPSLTVLSARVRDVGYTMERAWVRFMASTNTLVIL